VKQQKVATFLLWPPGVGPQLLGCVRGVSIRGGQY